MPFRYSQNKQKYEYDPQPEIEDRVVALEQNMGSSQFLQGHVVSASGALNMDDYSFHVFDDSYAVTLRNGVDGEKHEFHNYADTGTPPYHVTLTCINVDRPIRYNGESAYDGFEFSGGLILVWFDGGWNVVAHSFSFGTL